MSRFNIKTLFATMVFVAVVSVLSARQYRLGADAVDPAFRHWGMADFRDVVYYPTVAFLDGKNPYDSRTYMREYPVGNVFPLYLPAILVVNLPFGLLPVQVSRTVYWVLNLACYLLLARASLAVAGTRPSWSAVLLLASAVLVSTPGRANFNAGQVTLPAALGSLAAVHFAERRPLVGALGLAVAALKPTFGVPLAILMLARGKFRPVAYAAAIAGSLSAVALGVIAVQTDVDSVYDLVVVNQTELKAHPNAVSSTSTTRVDAYALLMHLLPLAPSAILELTCFSAVLGIAGIAGGATLARHARQETDCDWLLLAFLATLLCVYHQVYDVLLLVPPMAWLFYDLKRTRYRRSRRVFRWTTLICMLVPGVNILWAPMFLNMLERVSRGALTAAGLEGTLFWSVATMLNSFCLFAAFLLCLWNSKDDPGIDPELACSHVNASAGTSAKLA